MSGTSASGAVHRLELTGEQLFAERVHVNLASPVVQQYVRKQRTTLWALGGVLLPLSLFAAMLVPLSESGEPAPPEVPVIPIAGLAVALVILGYATLMPQLYRASVTKLERRAWSYVGDDGARLELSPAGLALDAPGRAVRIGWGYYDQVSALDTGLELRRRGGPVAFYPLEAFASESAMWRAAEDVRSWIAGAGAAPQR